MKFVFIDIRVCEEANLSNFFLFRNCSTGHLITQENHPTSHRSHMYHMGVELARLTMEMTSDRTLIFMSAPNPCVCSTDGPSVVKAVETLWAHPRVVHSRAHMSAGTDV